MFFSHSIGYLFNLVTICFAVQKLFSFIWSHLPELLEFYIGSYCLCLSIPVYSLHFPKLVSNFQALC
jgi:hypothetical protein